MPEKVEILVELKNDQEVKSKLKELQGICDKLSKGVTIKLAATDLDKVNKQASELSKSLVDVEKKRNVNMGHSDLGRVSEAASGVARQLQELERPHTININADQLLNLPSALDRSVRSWIQSAYGLDKQLPALSYDFYRQYVPNFVMQGDPYPTYAGYGFQAPATLDSLNYVEAEWHEVTAAAEEAQEVSNRPIAPDTTGIERVNSEIQSTTENARTLQDVFGGFSTLFSSIGGVLTGIGGLFDFNLLGTVKRTLTAYGTILGTQGFSKAVSRYDIMSTYADYMELMGVSAEKADESLDKINENIQGIPVGLDQAAQEIRMFTMYLAGTEENMDAVADKATDLAIGLEKALVAGGAAEYMKTTARYEINRLLATGSLGTSRQWQALLNGLGISSQYLRAVMGYTDISNREFISRLSAKDDDETKITTDEFLEGLAKLADYEDLNDAIEVYKSTISAWINNIGFALARGFENVFKAINEVLGGEDMGIIGNMEKIRGKINEVFLAASDWIKENPELVTTFVDKIGDVFERIKELNLGELALEIVENGGKLVDFLLDVSRVFPDEWLRKFIAFSVTWASPIGRIFSAVGGFFALLAKIPANGGLLGRILGGALGTGSSGGQMITGNGLLGLFGTIGGIAAMGGVIYEYAKVLESISKLSFGDNLSGNLATILTSIGVTGAIMLAFSQFFSGLGTSTQLGLLAGEGLTLGLEALIAAAGGVIYEFAKIGEAVSNLNLANFDENMKTLNGVLTQVAGFVLGTSTAYTALTGFTGGIGGLFAAIGEALTAGLIGDMNLAIDAINRCADMAKTVSDMDIADDVEEKVERLGKMLNGLYEAVNGEGITDETLNSSGYVSGFMQNMAKALESMNDAAQNLSNIEGKLNWLNRSEGKFDDIKTKVEEFAEGIGDIYQAFVTGFGPSWTAKHESGNYAETLTNMNTAMEELQGLATAMSNMEHLMDSLQLGLAGNEEITKSKVKTQGQGYSVEYEAEERIWKKDTFQKYTTRIREFLEGVDGIVDVLGGNFASAELEQWESSAQATAITNMGLALDSISGLQEKVGAFHETFDWDTSSRGITNILQFTKSLFGLFGTDTFQNWGNMTNSPQLAENFQNVALAFGGEDGSGGIMRIISTLNDVSDMIETVEEKQIVSKIGAVLKGIKTAFVDDFTAQDAMAMLKRSVYARRSVVKIKEMITNLSDIQGNLDTLFDGETNVGTQVGTLLKSMFSSFGTEEAESFSEKVASLGSVIGDVQGLFSELADTSLENLNGQAETLVGHMESLVPIMSDLSDNMASAKSEAGMLAANLQMVGTTAVIQNGNLGTLITGLGSLVASLNSAQSAASSLASAINSIPTNVSTTVTTLFPNGGRNMGGVGLQRLYRASGGPVGTDTVPAWLSPGEFVMRSKAVEMFGPAFMRNINNLNIAGAFNALVRQYTSPQFGGVSNVNNYDNHASVNQTIYTNNPDYSYKRASRYVRALS